MSEENTIIETRQEQPQVVTFESAGFIGPAIPSSETPEIDGYEVRFHGLPYNVHPTATPDAWALLQSAIADGAIVPEAYAPQAPLHTTPEQPEPTKAELLAQLAALTAKINALPENSEK